MRRLSKFLQLSAGIQSCRGNLFNLIVIIISYLPFDFFLIVLNYYYHSVTIVNTVVCATKNSWFIFSMLFLVFCKWYTVCSYKLGVLGPWEFFWRAGSCICFVCAPLVECWAGTSIFGHCGGVDGGTVRIFFPLAL